MIDKNYTLCSHLKNDSERSNTFGYYMSIYIGLYVLLCFLPISCGLYSEDKTGAYPDRGECVIGAETKFFYNALSYGEKPCLLVHEGLWGIQWNFIIMSLLLFSPLFYYRKKIWKNSRLAALPEWLLITILYFICLINLSPQVYANSQEYLETFRAVFVIFFPFLLWQFMVTIVFWIYRLVKRVISNP